MGKKKVEIEEEEEEAEEDEDGEEEEEDDDDDHDGGAKLQRSVFYWITEDKEEEEKAAKKEGAHRTISAEEVARRGVPLGILHNFVMEEIDEATAFLSLPLTMLLVVSYAYMVMGHVDPKTVRAVQDSIEFDIVDNANFAFDSPFMGHKNIDDVNSLTDFWSWLNNGFVPLIFHYEHPWGEYVQEFNESTPGGLAPSRPYVGETDFKRGMHIYYNRIVGGFRMVQERSSGDEMGCTTMEELLDFYGTDCVGGKGYELDPEMMVARLTSDPQREKWLLVSSSSEEVFGTLRDMEVGNWLDKKTKKIEISIAYYNAEYGLHSLVTVNFFFSRGGHIWKKVIPLSTYANWTDRKLLILVDFVWILSMFAVWILVIQDMIKVIRQFGVKGLSTEYLSFWSIIDWTSIMLSLLVLSMFYGAIVMTNAVNDDLTTLGDMTRGTAEYTRQAKKYMDSLHTCVHYVHKLSLLMSGYPLIIVFRLLKAFHSQPRLAAVTRTLEVAATELIHFLIIFTLVFASFAISGVVLFGRAVEEFATFPRAINACFLVLMGAWDWDAIKVVGRREAQMWLGLFLIVNSLLMMNMLLAIVMDAYSDVKSGMGAAETLVEEARQVFRRWMGARRGELCPLSKILNAIEMERKVQEMTRQIEIADVDDDESEDDAFDMDFVIITAEMLQDWVERSNRGGRHWTMSEDQALELIQAAVENYYEEHRGSATKNEVIMHMRKVDYRTRKIKEDADAENDAVPSDSEGEDEDEDENPKKKEESEDPFEVPEEDEDEEGKPVKVTMKNVATWLSEELPRFIDEVKADRLKSARQLTQLHAEIDELRALVAVGKRCGETSTGLPPWHGGLWQGAGGVENGANVPNLGEAGGLGATFGQMSQIPAPQQQPPARRASTRGSFALGRLDEDRTFDEEDVGDETKTFQEEMVPKMPGGGLRVTGLPMKKRMNEPQVYSNGVETGANLHNDLGDEDDMSYDEDDPEADLGDAGISDPEDGGEANDQMPAMLTSRDVGGFMGGIPDVLIRGSEYTGKGKGQGKGGRGKGTANPKEFRTFREAQQELRKIVYKRNL